jgi:hypothetical protein
MKTLHRDYRKDAAVQPNNASSNAFNAETPAWISSMGIEWLYSVLQKSDVLAKPKATR